MPRRAAETLNEQLDSGGEFFVPASESQVSGLSLIHAMRTMSDGMSRLADQQDRQSSKLGEVSEVIHGMDKRLAIIEANSLARMVDEHEKRIEALEIDKQRREGAINLADWFFKNWPGIIGFVALAMMVLVATGQLDLRAMTSEPVRPEGDAR